jgi:hypothetical protein
VLVTPATGRELFPAFLYVYVNTPYGDRRAMVRDPFVSRSPM